MGLTSSTTREPREFGLRQVYPLSTDESHKQEIDIIAIHGLDTHSPKTWEAWKVDGDPSSGTVHWLKDQFMLPSKIPNSRIFTYDWNANYDKDAATEGLLGHADSFLKKVHMQRSDDGTTNRPLIFVASCFGGLLLCKALHRASEGHSKYQYILKSTVGILFLGTPFQGSHDGVYSAMSIRLTVARAMGGETADALMKYMNNNDDERIHLDEVVDVFCEMAANESFKIPIMCFYETRRTDFSKIIHMLSEEEKEKLGRSSTGILVPKYSATIQGQQQAALDVRHGMLNKFAGPEDEAFKMVSFYIKEFARNALQNAPDAWIRKKHYTDERLSIVRLSGDHVSMSQCYINLAILSKNWENADIPSSDHVQPSPFSILARQNVRLPDKQSQIKLSAVFSPHERLGATDVQPRRILIRGRAGVGKTTLCKKMVYDFVRDPESDLHRTWTALFDRVLWICLRNLKGLTVHEHKHFGLEDLFYHEYFGEEGEERGRYLAKQLCQLLKSSRSDRSLFLLDGFDEISHDLSQSDSMPRVFQDLLSQPNVIITSRPHTGAQNLKNIDLELETIGFYPEQVRKYLEMDPRMEPHVSDILALLQKHWVLQGLVRIPVQLDALCSVWEQFRETTAPETMTRIYQAMETSLWAKDVSLLDKQHAGQPIARTQVTVFDVEGCVGNERRLLERLAFYGLYNNIIEFDQESVSKVSEAHGILPLKTLTRLSFLRTLDPISKHANQTYYFIHLTFQEYFAARYFARQWVQGENLKCHAPDGTTENIEPSMLMRQQKYTSRYDIFWRFVAGILDGQGESHVNDFFLKIKEEPRDLLGPTHQRLILHCLGEVSSTLPIRAELYESLTHEVWFEMTWQDSAYLTTEPEFPEDLLIKILLSAPDEQKQILLCSLVLRAELPPSVATYTKTLLDHPDTSVQHAARHALGIQSDMPRMAQDRSARIKSLTEALTNPHAGIRKAAAYALSYLPSLPTETVQVLRALSRDPDSDVSRAASAAIKRQEVSGVGGLDALKAGVQSKNNTGVEQVAAGALRLAAPFVKIGLQKVANGLEKPGGNARMLFSVPFGGRSGLLDKTLDSFTTKLGAPDTKFHNTAYALRRQLDMPEGTMTGLMAKARNSNVSIRQALVHRAGEFLGIPEDIIASGLARPEKSIRVVATGVGGILAMLSGDFMDSSSMLDTYLDALSMSYEEQLSWYLDQGDLYINMGDEVSKVPLDKTKEKNILLIVQLFRPFISDFETHLSSKKYDELERRRETQKAKC